jgi:hypothetical protein
MSNEIGPEQAKINAHFAAVQDDLSALERGKEVDMQMTEAQAKFTDDELLASAREDAFTGLIKIVATKQHPKLRDRLKPHFEAIMNEIDAVRVREAELRQAEQRDDNE